MPGVSMAVVRAQARKAEAALHNENLTRQRVEALETWVQAFAKMGFLRRLRWLVTGR